jgi:hypothetical protein
MGGVTGTEKDRTGGGTPDWSSAGSRPQEETTDLTAPRRVEPADGVFPGRLGLVGQGEEGIQGLVGHDLCVEPGPGHRAELQLGGSDDPGEADPAHGRGEPVGAAVGTAIDDLAIRPHQTQAADMIAERAGPVVVLAMDVVGDGAAHAHELGTRQDRQPPAPRRHQALDVPQQDTRFADQPAGRRIEGVQAVELRRAPEVPPGVEAGIAVAPAVSAGDGWSLAAHARRDFLDIGQAPRPCAVRRSTGPRTKPASPGAAKCVDNRWLHEGC